MFHKIFFRKPRYFFHSILPYYWGFFPFCFPSSFPLRQSIIVSVFDERGYAKSLSPHFFSSLKLIPLPSDQKSQMKPDTFDSITIHTVKTKTPYHHHLNPHLPPSPFSPFLSIFRPFPFIFYTFFFLHYFIYLFICLNVEKLKMSSLKKFLD